MKKLLLSFFVCCYAIASAQTSTGFLFPTATPAPNGGWMNPSDAFASDDVYTTVPHGSGCRCPFLYISGDGGMTYSSANIVGPFGTTDNTQVAGSSSDLWGTTWADTSFSNTNFRLKIANPSTIIEQGYGDFNFSIPAGAVITGIAVQVEEHGDASYTTEFVDAIAVNVYYTTTTGIATFVGTSGISIYPNPATDHLTVDHLSKSTQGVALTDMLGNLLMETTEFNADHCVFDMSTLPRGMYLLIVNDAEAGRLTKKVVLQ